MRWGYPQSWCATPLRISKPITDKEAMRDYVELRTSGVRQQTPLPEHIEPSLAGLIRRCVRHDLRDVLGLRKTFGFASAIFERRDSGF